ncbi:hypothetical protein O6H91_13G087600 [Diphasiastrum complanatum]|uniref:Uncharacterized protein n=1 Tax=Diphasiastrum complanatum TaxID=34168 RepID=A0ACC2BWW4_DIPCM|nr:hypothetical protein O6H91_13G087600 [Diphasiastrum complanatum]
MTAAMLSLIGSIQNVISICLQICTETALISSLFSTIITLNNHPSIHILLPTSLSTSVPIFHNFFLLPTPFLGFFPTMPSAAPVCNVLVQSDSGRWTLVEWYGLSLIMWCTTSPFHRIASSPAQPVHQSSTLSTASSVRRTSFTPSLTKQLQLPHQPTPLDSHISRLLFPLLQPTHLHSSIRRLLLTPSSADSF